MAKRLSSFINKSQTEKLENKEDIYINAQDVDTAIKYNSQLSSTKYFGFDTQYFPPIEPDGNKLRAWIRAHNLGNTVKDFSGEGGTFSLEGDPVLVDGAPFDDGIHSGGTKSKALRFNRPSPHQQTIDERIIIPHTSRTRASEDLVTGISFFIRFRLFDLAKQNDHDRCLYEKIDNAPITDGAQINLSTTGRVKFHMENDDIPYNMETATSAISLNTVYDVWCTYAISGNVQHIYVNNVDRTLAASDGSDFHPTTSNLDATVFSIGLGQAAGNVYGDLYDFRIYREKVVSAAEVGYMYTNKWTIANIPFGQVAVANYFATYDESPGGSFTSTSFNPTSFTI